MEQAGCNCLEDEPLDPSLQLDVETRRGPRVDALSHSLVLAGVELRNDRTNQCDEVALVAKARGASLCNVVDDPDHADDNGRVDPGAACVAVQAHVAAHNGDIERPASLADAVDCVVQI